MRALGNATGSIIGPGRESVDIRAASKNYDAVRALDNVTLNVARASSSPSSARPGSGKSTLLGILGGFASPTRGSIDFSDRDVTLMPSNKRNIGMVFQSYALFPHMTLAENVAFPLRAGARCQAEIG